MPTTFNTNFDDSGDDIIHASHVTQYADPINALESGATWYREATAAGNAYKVNFSSGNLVSSYTPGLLVHFKAPSANGSGTATLTVTGPSGDLSPVNLVKKGGTALAAGDIAAGQVVAAIYTEDAGALNKRFEVIGGIGGGGGLTSPVAIADGGTNSTNAADARIALGTNNAANITTGTLAVAQGGTNATDAAGARTNLGVPPSTRSISTTAPLTGGGNLSADRTISMPAASASQNGYLTSTAYTTFNNKQNALTGTGDVPGLTAALSNKEDKVPYGHAELGSDGKVLASQLPTPSDGGAAALDDLTDVTIVGTPSSGQVLRHNGTDFRNASLTPSDVGAAPAAHTHAASAIGAGTVDDTEFSYLNGVTSSLQGQLDSKAASSHGHALTDAGITGVLPVAKGGTGANLSGASGPGVLRQTTAGGNVSVSPLTAAEMPTGIDPAKLSPGTVSSAEFGYLDGVTSGIQGQLNNKQGLNSKLTDVAGLTLNKGDILTTDGTNIKDLAVGTDGQVLTADSTAVNGVRWADSASGGASNLDSLTDVVVSSPASGQVLRHDGTNFVNAALAATDIGPGTVSNTEFGYLDGVTSPIQTQLNGKLSGTVPISSGGTGATSASVARTNLGAAPLSHEHQFTDINGTVPISQGGTGATSQSGARANLGVPGGSGTTGNIAYWSGASTLASAAGTEVICGNLRATNIPGFATSGAVVYSYTSSTVPAGQVIGRHHHLVSSRKYKRNIRNMEEIAARLEELQPVRYEGTAPGNPDDSEDSVVYQEAFGLIAEDVQEVFPELVFSFMTSDGESVLGVHYDRLPVYLLQAMKEQQSEINSLKARMAALEGA